MLGNSNLRAFGRTANCEIDIGPSEADVGESLFSFTEIIQTLEEISRRGVVVKLKAPFQPLGMVGFRARGPGLLHHLTLIQRCRSATKAIGAGDAEALGPGKGISMVGRLLSRID